jgi:flagellar biosynthetic protein FliP
MAAGQSAMGQGESPAAEVQPDSPAVTMPSAEMLLQDWLASDSASAALRTLSTIVMVAVVPAILLMTTGFVRISVVLALLRQALGPGLFLSNQVMTALGLALTMIVMAPIWHQSYEQGIEPLLAENPSVSLGTAWNHGIAPIRQFMTRQIDDAGNARDVRLLLAYARRSNSPATEAAPTSYDNVPLSALLPAFLLSELKTAFYIGFRIYLPFLVIDLIVASLTTVLGMVMLSPTAISLPLKLVIFVMADGWNLVAGSLLQSFGVVP